MLSHPSRNNYYNKSSKTFARNLRKEGTKSEACLWKFVLRKRQMKGYQFLRQRPILEYIADFACLELKLVIELDGITHQWDETLERDRKKQLALEAIGFTVLRFRDEEVLREIHKVQEQIEWWIENKESKG